MNDLISKHVQEAISIAERISPEYRKVAFEVILNHLLTSELTEKIESRQALTIKDHTGINKILRGSFDWTSTQILELKPTPRILLILKIAKQDFGINELSASEVQKILKEKFRITKSVSAISMLLMEKLGKYVDRIQEGNKFYYRITENGITLVNSEMKSQVINR